MVHAFKYCIEMFEKFDLSKAEKEFIEGVNTGVCNTSDHVRDFYESHSIIANFYLAKQIETAAKSSERQATALNIFTIILIILTAAMLYKMVWQ